MPGWRRIHSRRRLPGGAIQRWLGNLLLAAASLGIGLLLVEAGARVVAWRAAARPQTVGILSRYDPLLGWAQPAGEAAWLREPEFTTHLTINSHGLRGPDRPYAKPPGVFRILLLGDSFTEGYTVPEALTVRSVLEQILSRDACPPREVLNAGVAGYGTDQEYLSYLHDGNRYHPDLVVLLFFGNDLADNARLRKKPYFDVVDGKPVLRNTPVPPPPPGRRSRRPEPTNRWSHPWRGSWALELLGRRTAVRPGLHRALAHLGLVRPFEAHGPTTDWLSSYGPPTPVTADMWRRTLAILGALDEAVKTRGSQLVVFYVPARFEVDSRYWAQTRSRWQLDGPGWDPERVFRRLYRACAVRGIPVVDPRGAFRASERSGRSGYLSRDPHWNAVGHRLAAESLAQFLRDEDYLPPCD